MIRTYNIGMSSALFFRLTSIAVLLAIWILSLLPVSDLPRAPGTDKLHHVIAYFACMFCWGQWFTRPVPRLKLVIAFIAMGALIECLHDPDERDLELCQRMVEACYESDDYTEGQAAFMEKRKPAFKGR